MTLTSHHRISQSAKEKSERPMPGQGNVKPTLKRQVRFYIQRQARAHLTRPSWRIITIFLIVAGAAALLMAILTRADDGISNPPEKVWRRTSRLLFRALPKGVRCQEGRDIKPDGGII
ncbi:MULTISPECIES: hypothetical protein [Bacteria]|uniref:hypothetical protein n=1 Tax=Bacteria TaxID=2 RepID=UPI0010573DB5|nr:MULTISPECIES: hypothetical protein [Bacteria]